jgi:hypothetical protein
LRLRTGENLHKAQARYRNNYDRGVVRKNTELSVGDESYLRVEVIDVGRNHKLESLVQGPYWVMENCGTTLKLGIGDEVVRVSSDRVTRAPNRTKPGQQTRDQETLAEPAELTQTSETVPPIPSPRFPKRARFALPEVSSDGSKQDYVVDRVVDAQMNHQGRVLYQVSWLRSC